MSDEIRLAASEGSDVGSGIPGWVQNAIENHENSLLRYAQHFVHDLESARDVVQDTFLQLCRKPDEKLQERMPQWLYTVCRNRAIDICRKERRMKLAPENQLAGELADSTDPATNPVAALERSEAAEGLMSQVSKLPDRQQEILRLKFHAGLSYKEIAEVMGITSTNVGFILHSAISKLRQRLAVEGS